MKKVEQIVLLYDRWNFAQVPQKKSADPHFTRRSADFVRKFRPQFTGSTIRRSASPHFTGGRYRRL